MALEEKRGQLGKSVGFGSPMEKAPTPPPKEDAFGKSGHINPDEARELLRRRKNEIYQKYKLGGTEVEELSRKITDPRYGSLTGPDDLKKYEALGWKKINKMTNLDEKTRARTKLEKEVKTLKGLFLEKK